MSNVYHEVLTLKAHRTHWLDAYAEVLEHQMHPVSREIVLDDAKTISDLAVLAPGDPRWPGSRERTGVVVGAVQSGKTASMIGMTARALDTNVNVVVILAGRQTALWLQTMNRVRRQLVGNLRRWCRFLPVENMPDVSYSPETAYGIRPRRVERDLRQRIPIVFVAMKEVHHLDALGRVLRNNVYPKARDLGYDVNLLVIDDEADDASVADDELRWTDDEVSNLKRIPRKIVALWEGPRGNGRTIASHVYATYVAYTATAQANFLQDEDNPLAPKNFVAALRTPGPEGMRRPRQLHYRVEGIENWYTGADLFYDIVGDHLCVQIDTDRGSGTYGEHILEGVVRKKVSDDADNSLIVHSIRAFLVGAAIRVVRSGKLGPASAAARSFGSRGEAEDAIAPVTSMLIHPSSDTQSHFDLRDLVYRWWNGAGGSDGSGVITDLYVNEARWREVLADYVRSSDAFSVLFKDDLARPREVPPWEDVLSVICDELVPATRIDVVNSSDEADGRPVFEVQESETGKWLSPVNHCSIFVSGNVMSRGLTLEGLLTTVFTRASRRPLADTQMQMQRWFGYRGAYLDLCRVFLTSEQKSLFQRYADGDKALRAQVLAAMDRDDAKLPDFTVLQGRDYFATGKVAGLGTSALMPGPLPFIRKMNPPGHDDHNLEIISSLFRGSAVVEDSRGLLLRQEMGMTEVAGLLDSLRYDRLGREDAESARWSQVERLLDLDPRLEPRLAPLYRAPQPMEAPAGAATRSPYVLAAYLRLWVAALDRDVPGLMTSDDPAQRWNLVDAESRYNNAPRFRVGLRFGRGAPVEKGPLATLGDELGVNVRPMQRAVVRDELTAEWGSRRQGDFEEYRGDEVFDANILGIDVSRREDGARVAGQPGLLLFHPVLRSDASVTLAIGMSIPLGGPDYIQAVNARRNNGLL